MTYTVIIRAGNEGGYVASVPALPGCVSQGRTCKQALRNAKEAVEAYIEALIEDGLPVPTQTDTELIDVEVQNIVERVFRGQAFNLVRKGSTVVNFQGSRTLSPRLRVDEPRCAKSHYRYNSVTGRSHFDP